MENRQEIRYINAYVSGNIAYQLEPKAQPKRKHAVLPKQHKEKKTVIRVDPVAIGGIAIALVLLVLLGVGFVRLQTAQAEAKALEDYVVSLQEKNDRLYAEYSAGYDLAEIEKIALAMGMVPSSQVPHISMDVTVPQQEAEPTAWENFCAFLTGLFA